MRDRLLIYMKYERLVYWREGLWVWNLKNTSYERLVYWREGLWVWILETYVSEIVLVDTTLASNSFSNTSLHASVVYLDANTNTTWSFIEFDDFDDFDPISLSLSLSLKKILLHHPKKRFVRIFETTSISHIVHVPSLSDDIIMIRKTQVAQGKWKVRKEEEKSKKNVSISHLLLLCCCVLL